MTQQLERKVRKAKVTHGLALVKCLFFSCRELGFCKGQIDQTGEQSDVDCWHFLAGQDDTAVHTGYLALLVTVHVHAAASGSIPESLQELALVQVDAVLVFVDMHQGVGALGHGIAQGGDGGVLNVGRRVLDDEERHQAVAKLRLTASLRAEQVQNGEALGLADDDIAEQRGQQKADAYLGVIAEHLYQLVAVLPQADIVISGVDEFPLELKELHVVAVDGAAAGQVVVSVLQPDNAVLVSGMPFGVEGSVAEGEEPLTLPAQLCDFDGGLGLLV